MPPSKISPAVQLVLDYIRENHGDYAFTEDDAQKIYGGHAKTVKDLTQTEILQFALLTVYRERDDLLKMVEGMKPNRAQRRGKK